MTAETLAPTPTRPTPLTVGAGITMALGLALSGWGVYDLVAPLFGDAADLARSEYGGAVLVLLGVLPVLASRALLRLRRWGRSPAVLTNSLCLPVAYYMWQAGGLAAVAAVAVGLLGLTGIVTLLNPRCTAVLYRTEE